MRPASLPYLLSFVASFLLCLTLKGQEQRDSLVILMSAKSAQTVDVEGASYRKIVGPARFLHNGTFLICDTALWNIDTRIIEAWGNVRILQEETVLDSDKLTYIIDEDLAQFRGTTVQLQDKDYNTLRTRHLDYNTKDSVAIFRDGGSMRDKDGQIIESRDGTYDSKIKTFTFSEDVNMFTDSIFVKTGFLKYESDLDLATFSSGTDAWKDDNMLSSSRGWYDRGRELFFFRENVHVMSEQQEGWSDSLFFYRATSDVEMLGNVQVSDTTRNVFAIAGRIHYNDSSSRVTLTRKPAVITQTEEVDGSVDTVYLGADKLVYRTVMMCDVDSLELVLANERLSAMQVDPVGNYRKKAAEAAAKAAEEAAKNDPNYRPKGDSGKNQNMPQAPDSKPAGAPKQPGPGDRTAPPARTGAAPDSLAASPMPPRDSLAMASDSSGVATDSLTVVPEEPKDTTKIGFLQAISKVKIFKKDMQVVCDSLLYSDLDSLARMFNDPMIWQESVRQYSADSISVAVSKGTIDKASLMSNAFITIKEDTLHFDQIKGTEMLAYFGEKSTLERFDVLGGASAVFFIEENQALATVNKAESKMLSAVFKDGQIQKVHYYDEAKNDGYPVVQLTREEQRLKGFKWNPELRPADRNAVTPLSLRPSQRKMYSSRPRAKFTQTEIYFPGYIGDIQRQIRVRDSLRVVREREAARREQMRLDRERLDSIALADSLAQSSADSLVPALADSLGNAGSVVLADSLATKDSIGRQDSLANVATDKVQADAPSSKEQQKAERQAQKEKAAAQRQTQRDARQARQEAKWAELDKRDAEKLRLREEKKQQKLREKKRKAIMDAARQAEKDAQALEKYRQRYQKKLEREQQRKNRRTKR
ncbi:MAG: OstA-like protein [Candidatus Cryptobacteroides sp.]